MPLCRTPEERLFFQQTIFDRIVAYWNYHASNDRDSTDKLIAECLERLRYEGNTHLLGPDEAASVLHGLQPRLHEVKLLDRSRTRKAIYQLRQRSRLAALLYPKSGMRKVIFQARHLVQMVRNQISRIFGS